MHGLGNDFVIMGSDNIIKSIEFTKLSKDISNRRVGIGCDQFILYERKEKFVSMAIYNQDGTPAKACGNASRCLSRLMFDNYGATNIVLDINGRKVECQYFNKDEIQVNIGPAIFENSWMPMFEELWNFVARYGIEPKEAICVDVANPHLVIFSKLTDKDQKIVAENFQNTDLFKEGINVNFASVLGNNILLKVWERGAGFTLACGSGACATFAAANKLGFVPDKSLVKFTLGELKMKKLGQDIVMVGPASYVFKGEYYYG